MTKNYFSCTTNKAPYDYACGEEIIFFVVPPEGLEHAHVRWELRGDHGIEYEGAYAATPFRVEVRIPKPGCVTLKAWAAGNDGTPLPGILPLETGAGAELSAIRALSPKPADYDEFWNRCRTALYAVEPHEISREKLDPPAQYPTHRVYDVRIACAGSADVSGILTIPPGEDQFPCRVEYQGYGVKSAWTTCLPDEICLCINAHGIDNRMPEAYYTGLSETRLKNYGFDPVENQSPDTCYFRSMMLRSAQALRYMRTLPQWDGEHLTAWGGSQGAVQAMHGTYMVPEVTRLEIFVPWLCDVQADPAVRYNNWGDMGRNAVRYFDLTLRAPAIRCAVTVKVGMGDRTAPPGCICAMYNQLNTKKELCLVQSMGHNNPTPDAKEWMVPECSVKE